MPYETILKTVEKYGNCYTASEPSAEVMARLEQYFNCKLLVKRIFEPDGYIVEKSIKVRMYSDSCKQCYR